MSAVLGFALSFVFSAVVSFLFPAQGPRLKDLSVSSSTYGNPIPWVWGTVRVGGNMIWSKGITEHKKKKKAGIGQFYTQYTYTADFAMALCKGPAQALRRIWANGKLIYDATGQSRSVANGKFRITFYNGTEDQMPDPAIQAHIGVANTPAYRGTAYIVFHDFKLEDYGNQIPQIAAEVYVGPESNVPTTTLTEDGSTPITNFQTGSIGFDPDRGKTYLYRTGYTLVRVDNVTGQVDRTQAVAPVVPDNFWDGGTLNDIFGVAYDGAIIGRVGGANNNMCVGAIDPNSMTLIGRAGHSFPYGDTYAPDTFPVPPNSDSLLIPTASRAVFNEDRTGFLTMGQFGELWAVGVDAMYQVSKEPPPNSKAAPQGRFGGAYTYRSACAGPNGTYFVFYGGESSGNFDTSGIPHDHLHLIEINGDRLTDVQLPDFYMPNPDPEALPLLALACVYDAGTNSVILFYENSVAHYASKYSIDTNSIVWSTKLPGGFPAGYQASNIFNGQIAWAANGKLWLLDTATGTFINRAPDQGYYADNNWLSEQDIEYSNPGNDGYTLPTYTGGGLQYYDGLTGSITALPVAHSGQHATFIRANQYAASTVTLDYIIKTLFAEAGLEPDDYDLSAFSSVVVRGYGFAEVTDIKSVIGQLQQVFLFDLVERNRQLVGVVRGLESVSETLSYKALGTYSGDSNTADFWKETRLSEADLPAQVSLKYLNVDQDFEEGSAVSKRILTPLPTVFSRQQDNVELNLVFNPTEAKNRANAMLYVNWSERTKHNTRTPLAYSYLEPSDRISVTTPDGRNYFERVMRTEFGADLSSQIETRGQDSGAYLSDVIGDGGSGSGQTVDSPVPARAFIFNTPYLRDIDTDGDGAYSIFYAGVGSLVPDEFNGATMFVSTDGTSYDIFQSFTDEVEWGAVTTATPAPIRGAYALDWDTKVVIWPAVSWFLLQSITDDDLWKGANMCMLGDEVIQFRDAEENEDGSWTIWNLLRGRRGTEWAIDKHVMGEKFVYLSVGAVGIGSQGLDEVNKTFWYKAVGNGRSLENATTLEVDYAPRDLMPYAPEHLSAQWLGGDISISFVRRTRYGGNMQDGTGIVPLNEKTEAYEVDIYAEDGETILRTLSATFGATPTANPSVTYKDFDIAADFDQSPTTITVEVFQIGVTGRGFGTKQTLTISGTASPTTRYWGASASTSLDEAGVLALGGQDLSTDLAKDISYNCSGGKYPYYAYPKAFGLPTNVLVNSLPFSAYTTTTLSIADNDYYVIRFDNIQHGDGIPVKWQ